MIRSLRIAIVFLFLNVVIAHAQEITSATQDTGSDAGVWQTSAPENPNDYSPYERLGLSRGASAIYRGEKPYSLSGYGELVHENFADKTNLGAPSNMDQQFDIARAVVFLGYRWSDRLVFNSEIRIDRNITDSHSAKISADLAYVDYFLAKDLSLRGGMLLVPMGLVNEFHGPDEFLGTHPPLGDLFTLPTIWHAVGIGVAGHVSIGDFRAYLVNGLNATGLSIEGTRDSREVSWNTIKKPAFVFRVDGHIFHGAILGGSMYIGRSGVFDAPQPPNFEVPTNIQEAHFQVRYNGWFARTQYAKANFHNTPQLNLLLGVTGLNGIGSRMVGGYAEGGYDFWHSRTDGKKLMPYFRGEVTNPQDGLPPASIAIGEIKNLFVDHTVYTYGLELRVIPNLIIKTEYQQVHAEKFDTGVNQFNIAMSYTF